MCKKGKREIVKCEKCGTNFDRSVFQPYVKRCPDCREKQQAPQLKLDENGHMLREDVKCQCGKTFSRSVYHTYLTLCPECRKLKKEAKKHRVKCAHCRAILETTPRLGYQICQCGKHWWHLGPKYPGMFIDKSAVDELLYENGELVGPANEVLDKLRKM